MVEDLRTRYAPEGEIPEVPDSPEVLKERVPEVIQGGMGMGVSDWEMARAVAIAGEKLDKRVLGVVSGTGLPVMLINRLQENDPNTIRALNAFNPEIAKEILDEYLPGDKKLPGQRHKFPPKPEVLVTGRQEIKDKMNKISVAAAFVEVWLARQGHDSSIGMNLLEKLQLMHLPTILGAMMAGVDTIIVGAGIPHQIPQILEDFVNNKEATYKIDVKGSKEKLTVTLDPKKYVAKGAKFKRPNFYAIVSHHTLAKRLNEKMRVDGFIIEGPTAGGHNAPTRNKGVFDERGQPVYGERDKPDLGKIIEMGKPYWLAGSYATRLREAQEVGATGVQVGSVFALCNESGFIEEGKNMLRDKIRDNTLEVVTSAISSPTGYPFQEAQAEGSLTDEEIYNERKRVCSAGYLVQVQLNEDGKPVFSCPAEPVKAHVRKGGNPKDTEGAVCICNGLAAAVGQGQAGEPAIYTLGKDLEPVRTLIKGSANADGSYSAEDVVDFVFSDHN